MIFKTLHNSLNDNINISTKTGDEPGGYTVPTPLVAVVVLLLLKASYRSRPRKKNRILTTINGKHPWSPVTGILQPLTYPRH
jgi:hypothetical protein